MIDEIVPWVPPPVLKEYFADPVTFLYEIMRRERTLLEAKDAFVRARVSR